MFFIFGNFGTSDPMREFVYATAYRLRCSTVDVPVVTDVVCTRAHTHNMKSCTIAGWLVGWLMVLAVSSAPEPTEEMDASAFVFSVLFCYCFLNQRI